MDLERFFTIFIEEHLPGYRTDEKRAELLQQLIVAESDDNFGEAKRLSEELHAALQVVEQGREFEVLAQPVIRGLADLNVTDVTPQFIQRIYEEQQRITALSEPVAATNEERHGEVDASVKPKERQKRDLDLTDKQDQSCRVVLRLIRRDGGPGYQIGSLQESMYYWMGTQIREAVESGMTEKAAYDKFLNIARGNRLGVVAKMREVRPGRGLEMLPVMNQLYTDFAGAQPDKPILFDQMIEALVPVKKQQKHALGGKIEPMDEVGNEKDGEADQYDDGA